MANMNFAVPFVLIHLICTSMAATLPTTTTTAAAMASSAPNEPTDSDQPPRFADPNMPINVAGLEQGSTTAEMDNSSLAGNRSDTMMSASDLDDDYVQEEAASDKSGRGSQQLMDQAREQDFQELFYSNSKFKEKDVPVPFTFSNFKRQQPLPGHNFNGLPQGQQQPRGRSSWPPPGQPPPQYHNHHHQQQQDVEHTREITIKQGRVKGIVRAMYRDSGLRDVDQFLGLPYAEAPVGNKRFMPPGKTCSFTCCNVSAFPTTHTHYSDIS